MYCMWLSQFFCYMCEFMFFCVCFFRISETFVLLKISDLIEKIASELTGMAGFYFEKLLHVF